MTVLHERLRACARIARGSETRGAREREGAREEGLTYEPTTSALAPQERAFAFPGLMSL